MAYKKGHPGYWKDKGCGPWSGKKRPEVSTWLKQFPKGFVPWNKGKTKEEYPQLSINKGEANGMWRGGATPERNKQLATSRWFKLRWKIYKRDNFYCQICGKYCIGHDIQCHHIIPLILGGNDDNDNLVVLCRRCHRKVESGKLSNFWLFYLHRHIKITPN